METLYEPGGPHDELFEGTGTGQDEGSDRSSQLGPRGIEVTPPSTPSRSAEDPDSPSKVNKADQDPSVNPNDFAPRGPPKPRKWRGRIPNPLDLKKIKLEDIQNTYTNAVNATVDGNGQRKFLEELRFIIVSSQLLDAQPQFGATSGAPLPTHLPDREPLQELGTSPWTVEGATAAVALSFGIAALTRWFFIGGIFAITFKRVVVAGVGGFAAFFLFSIYIRRQWLQYIHVQMLREAQNFVHFSAEFDSALGSGVSFIVELELVARGYRLSTPMPPVSRLENPYANVSGQNLRGLKIRKELYRDLREALQCYSRVQKEVEEYTNKTDLKAMAGAKGVPQDLPETVQTMINVSEEEGHKTMHLRALNQVCQELRKSLLLTIFCLESKGDSLDYSGFTTAMQGLHACNKCTSDAAYRTKKVLLADQLFTEIKTPKTPRSPRFDHWRHQIRRIGTMNTGIRGLQAKMALLAEESSEILTGQDTDLSELGEIFTKQYEQIGQDLKQLMEAWENGRRSLQEGIAENIRKSSIMSAKLSPTPSTRSSGLQPPSISSISDDGEEQNGTPEDALRKLEGNSSPVPTDDLEEKSWEAVAGDEPVRPRSTLSREERIKKMKEEREAKQAAREQKLQNGYVIGELKDVLQSREQSDRLTRTRGNSMARKGGYRAISLPILARTPPSPGPGQS